MTNPEAAPGAELSSLEATFAEAWRLYKERLWLLLTVGGIGAAGCLLAVFLPFLAGAFLIAVMPVGAALLIAGLVSVSAALWGASWAQVAMTEAVLDPARKPEWGECYKVSWPKVAAFSWVCILMFVVTVGALVPFVLPGVFLGFALAFAPLAAVAEGESGWRAVTRSLDLVSGRWWPVAVRLFLAGLASALPAKVPLIGPILGAFSAPFAFVAVVVVYHELKRRPPSSEPASAWATTVPLGLSAFGLLLSCWLSVKTVEKVREELPAFQSKLGDIMAHPPDPEKLQEVLLKLQSGETTASLSQTYQLLQTTPAVSTSTAAPTVPPSGPVP